MTTTAVATAAPSRWFLLSAILTSTDGQIGQVATVAPAESEKAARSDFLETLLANQCQSGFAVRDLSSAELSGLIIQPVPPPAPAKAAEEPAAEPAGEPVTDGRGAEEA